VPDGLFTCASASVVYTVCLHVLAASVVYTVCLHVLAASVVYTVCLHVLVLVLCIQYVYMC